MQLDTSFLLDQLAVPWGTNLLTVTALTPERQWQRDDSGWPNLSGACQSVLGLAATTCRLRAPAPHKPVLKVDYLLASPPDLRETTAPAYWLRPLSLLFGPPAETSPVGTPGPEPSALLLRAVWPGGAHRLTLLVYRAPYATQVVPTATLVLEWTDELLAAQPLLPSWREQETMLEAAARSLPALILFTLQEEQPSSTAPATPTQLTQAQRALYLNELYQTPAALQARLTTRQAALWRTGEAGAWLLSTHSITTLLLNSSGADVTADLVTTLPAKGGGFMSLHVGKLALYDAYKSPVLEQLAAVLSSQAAVKVTHLYNHDC